MQILTLLENPHNHQKVLQTLKLHEEWTASDTYTAKLLVHNVLLSIKRMLAIDQ